MRSAAALSVLLLWQIAAAAQSPSRHLRYERPLSLPQSASGQACAVLDGTVFSHTDAPGAGDLRIFGHDKTHEFEVPFALIESAPATLETQPATLRNVTVRDGRLNFDLAMQGPEYSDVALQINRKNFLGLAEVSGISDDGRATPLGTSNIFDLTSEGLARSTVLSVRRSSYSVLHVALRLFDLNGSPLPLTASIITGASVPPSGEEQAAYTTVASTSAIEQQGHWSMATMIVPARVPVEHALFILKPEFHADFLRDVTVTATPMEGGLAALGAAEGVSGHIYRVVRNAAGSTPVIDSHLLGISTVIGANLRAPAKITASVDNAHDAPLPVQRVELQMYQRRLCFNVRPGTAYALYYGDSDLSAPSYGYARRFVFAAAPLDAALGPERPNSGYISRSAEEKKRKPGRDLPWLLAMVAIVVAAVTTLQFVRHRH